MTLVGVLEGGYLGRGVFVFHTRKLENNGNHEMKFENNSLINTINSGISRNHENHGKHEKNTR